MTECSIRESGDYISCKLGNYMFGKKLMFEQQIVRVRLNEVFLLKGIESGTKINCERGNITIFDEFILYTTQEIFQTTIPTTIPTTIQTTIPTTIPTTPSPSPLPSGKNNSLELLTNALLRIINPFVQFFKMLCSIFNFWF